MLARAQPSLKTNWDTCLGLSHAYDVLREIDPYHITFGAIDAHGQDMWSFSDGTGALSLDGTRHRTIVTYFSLNLTGRCLVQFLLWRTTRPVSASTLGMATIGRCGDGRWIPASWRTAYGCEAAGKAVSTPLGSSRAQHGLAQSRLRFTITSTLTTT